MNRLCPHFLRAFVLLSAGVAAAAAGCKSRPAPDTSAGPPIKPPVQMLSKPAIDLTRGGGGFPLATNTVPTTAPAIADALRTGYAQRLVSPHLIRVEVLPGTGPGRLAKIDIDISGSAVRPDFVPQTGNAKPTEPAAFLSAGLFRYIADPLKYQHFTAGMRLEASRATVAVLPADDGTFGLQLFDCDTAHARIELSMAGLRESMAAGLKTRQSMAFMVDKVDLDLTSDNPRSLAADVTVNARLLLVPADFRLRGRIDIDDAFNVHFTGLDATGINPAGKVVAGVIQSRLDKVNNKAAPLIKMPGDRIKVSGVAIWLCDNLVIDTEMIGSQGGVAEVAETR